MIDPETVGGAHLVGTKGVVVIAHGASSHRAIANAVVMAAEDLDLDAAPEEGLAAKIAQATDEFEAARKKAALADKAAAENQSRMESLENRLKALEEQGISGAVPLDAWKALKADLKDVEASTEKAYRRAIKAKIKAEDAFKAVDALRPGSIPDAETPEDNKPS